MKSIFVIWLISVACLLILFAPDVALASDYASFASFYKKSLSLTGWIIASTLAVAGVAAVFFTSGAAAPFTATIGSAIGGMMGLSGAAATSAGLAFLGGGSLAAGGFGMLGGTVLLTAIFEGTLLTGGQIAQSMIYKKNYSELCEQVKDYPNFPPIINEDGPKVISLVVEGLEKNYDMQQLPSSPQNISAIDSAIKELNSWKPAEERFYNIDYKNNVRKQRLRIYSLKSLLEFMRNDYEMAYKFARMASSEYRTGDGLCTVPEYIEAVAGLFTGKITIQISTSLFRKVIRDEGESPILPLLFSIYISRVGALNLVDNNFLEEIIISVRNIPDKEVRGVVCAQVMTAILAKLWENQEAITFLAQNADQIDIDTISEKAKQHYDEYKKILRTGDFFLMNVMDHDTSDSIEFFNKSRDSLMIYFGKSNSLRNTVDKMNIIENAANINNESDDNHSNNLQQNDNNIINLSRQSSNNSGIHDFYNGIREFKYGNKDKGIKILREACDGGGYEPACIFLRNNL